ncbi:carboxylate--amine ligase [Pseudactinotalea sp.]|uniref:carboxylate--amine ligase n=1 Tax=Pseudactinotalea sp. TaxID=1926260 RepID=UPI003B3BB67C
MPTKQTVRPIVVGGDIGAYASARAFHEAYGVTTVVLAGVSVGPVAHSAIVDLRIVPGLDDDATLVSAVQQVVAEQPGVPHLVLGSADHAVLALVRVRAQLGDVVVPYVDAPLMERVTSKAGFSRLCAELDIPHPRTHVVRVGSHSHDLGSEVTFPAVVKASSSAEFHDAEFEGKRKVAYAADATELTGMLDRMAAAGFSGEVVVQERIPGGDEDMAAVNAFSGQGGRTRFLLFGQVLLEEATPNGLGNSVAQITAGADPHGHRREAVEHARRLLDHLGWTGFANLDLKRDPRDGRYRFLELNPRVGRSGYAVTAAGYNVATMYCEAYLDGDSSPSEQVMVGEAEHLFTVVPLALLRRYVSAETWQRIRALQREGAVTNPYYYRAETNPRRWFYVITAMINQFRKFARWHR